MTTGARPDGMGQAFSAVADDINTLSFNPAGLGNIRLPEIGYGYESFAAGINYNFLGAGIPLGEMGVMGLGYISMGTAPFNSTANPSAPLVSAQDEALVAGWGRSFYDLHVGASVKYIIRQLDAVQGTGLAFDLGLRYRPMPTLTLAASAMNLGEGIRLASLEPLPTVLNTGIAWTLIEEPLHTLTLAVNGAFDLATNTQQAGLGAEYWYQDEFALRAGYLANSIDTTVDPDGFSAGAGIRVSFFQLDYAFQPFNTLGMVHRVSGILRWDGPWIAGGEPNPPKYVNAEQTDDGIIIRWEKPQGPADSYEILIQPLDGGPKIVSDPVRKPPYCFKSYKPETLYRIAARTVNGGKRSFPSPDTYLFTSSLPPSLEREVERSISPTSITHGVRGQVDAVGLHLSWKSVPGSSGYQLYRQSPAGRVEKVSLVPKRNNEVWVTDTSGDAGWKWIVTTIRDDGEKVVGALVWNPLPAELDRLAQPPAVKLHASPELSDQVYLDWSVKKGYQPGYSLFLSKAPDFVYEFFEDLNSDDPTVLLKMAPGWSHLFFLVAPKIPEGGWSARSNQAMVEPLPQVDHK
jgi:hypothetical protein